MSSLVNRKFTPAPPPNHPQGITEHETQKHHNFCCRELGRFQGLSRHVKERDQGGRVASAGRYGVLVAVDGVHALGVAAEHQGRIDLLLSDIESSSTDSRGLWSATREQRPDTKILFMSTSAWRNGGDTSAIPEDVYQLQRPFDVERLEDAIHGALNGPSKPNPPGEPSALDGVF